MLRIDLMVLLIQRVFFFMNGSLFCIFLCCIRQIITRVKGGKIGRALKGADMGLRSITIAKDNEKLRSYFGGEVPASLAIIKCHQDEVLELPESATVLASSEVCEVEMFSIGDHLLCIQGHPEYNKEILFEIVDRVLNMKLMEVCSCSL